MTRQKNRSDEWRCNIRSLQRLQTVDTLSIILPVAPGSIIDAARGNQFPY